MRYKKVLQFLFNDIFTLLVSFLFIAWLKQSSQNAVLHNYLPSFLAFLGIWVSTSFLIGKYNTQRKQPDKIISSLIKCGLFSIGFVSILVYLFHMFEYSRLMVFGTIGLTTAIEVVFYFIYFRSKPHIIKYGLAPLLQEIQPEVETAEKIFSHVPSRKPVEYKYSLYPRLEWLYSKENPEMLELLDTAADLRSIPAQNALILDTNNPFNITSIDKKALQFFYNLHRINDMRRINRYLLTVNDRLANDGLFIGCVETNQTRYKHMMSDYPNILGKIIFPLDFFWRRVCPKIPVFKQLYFALTNGRNRAVAKSEIIGRLYFTGFDVVGEFEYDNLYYFVAQKKRPPGSSENPSYGPFIKLKRIGERGEIIHIFKIRTMAPYSEFAQEYLYMSHKLDKSGKFKDDFRVTAWGKVFRRFWIDELPQLINLIRGEVRIFGVRAISEHYFSLYPKELQELRIRTKPGLIPPYYVDLPKSFNDIVESERRYLESYLKKPWKTDIKYFSIALWNIVIRGKRSR